MSYTSTLDTTSGTDAMYSKIKIFLFGDLNKKVEKFKNYLLNVKKLKELNLKISIHNLYDRVFVAQAFGYDNRIASLGLDFLSKDVSMTKCLAEFLERYTLFNPPALTFKLKYETLKSTYDMVTYLDSHSFKYIKPNMDLPITCLQVDDVLNNTKVLYPAQPFFVSNAYLQEGAIFSEQNSNGMAAHIELDTAYLNATLEVLERDAFLNYWLTKTAPSKILIEITDLEDIEAAFCKSYILFDSILKDKKVNFELFSLQTESQVPIVLGVLDFKNSGRVKKLCVTGKGLDFREAILSVSREAIQLLPVLLSEEKWSENYSGLPNIDTRPYIFVGRNISNLDFLYSGQNRNLIDLLSTPKQEFNFKSLVSHLHMVYKDLNLYTYRYKNDAISHSPFYVVRVVIPQMLPLYLDEKYAYKYSKRLESFNLWKNQSKFDFSKINNFPHPYI